MSKTEKNRTKYIRLRLTESEEKIWKSYMVDSIDKDTSKAIRRVLFDHISRFYSLHDTTPAE